jgi:uncharacterized membrane protein YhaH (DUF805 family)
MFKKPFSFQGRIGRLEYGITALVYWTLLILLQTVAAEVPLASLFIFPLVFVMLAQGAKRCHDVAKNGFWQIIPFYIFFLIFQPGTGELNEYGYPPRSGKEDKEITLEAEIGSIGADTEKKFD